MTHWQCLCPQFKDSRVAAHNNIWNALASLLKKHSPLDINLEQPMSASKLHIDPRHSNWRPDGIALDNPNKTIFLLEFTRCSDNRNLPDPRPIECKEVKYLPLLESARSLNPNYTIELLTFAIGYLGSLDQQHFQKNLTALGVSAQHHNAIRQSTISATLSAFAQMATERSIAVTTASPPRNIRPWTGQHKPLKPKPRPPRL
jgi:hypothetical protein